MVTNKKKRIIVAVIALLFAVTMNFAGCGFFGDDASGRIEVVEEPVLKYRIVGNRYSPTVQERIKNISGETVKVRMNCVVYAKDGSVTTGLESTIVTLVAGETATITAYADYSYSALYYVEVCASFGKVEYKFY